ncbi:MAG TPA: carboxypeptidase-like regulatory domain-containing protein [Bryobacteraceae bacterium]|nr:carboxypeptidase-like regulatory domain-containing protein [Bryobacteraceae bacterium]
MILALLALVAPMVASSPETTIRVVVKNQYEKPVENAAVILDFLGSHQIMKLGKRKPIHWEVKTNQEGVAHFPPVPEGTVQLQVINSRYQTYGKKMDVAGEEKTVEITLNPPQKQYSAHPPLKPAGAPK